MTSELRSNNPVVYRLMGVLGGVRAAIVEQNFVGWRLSLSDNDLLAEHHIWRMQSFPLSYQLMTFFWFNSGAIAFTMAYS